mmetsp:Transcript_22870/g.38870  ORF Transcript_22870/g.38870 Transcript_22870/m.38870 type:complete len:223 (-) Transcript_22870:97-765(-)
MRQLCCQIVPHNKNISTISVLVVWLVKMVKRNQMALVTHVNIVLDIAFMRMLVETRTIRCSVMVVNVLLANVPVVMANATLVKIAHTHSPPNRRTSFTPSRPITPQKSVSAALAAHARAARTVVSQHRTSSKRFRRRRRNHRRLRQLRRKHRIRHRPRFKTKRRATTAPLLLPIRSAALCAKQVRRRSTSIVVASAAATTFARRQPLVWPRRCSLLLLHCLH